MLKVQSQRKTPIRRSVRQMLLHNTPVLFSIESFEKLISGFSTGEYSLYVNPASRNSYTIHQLIENLRSSSAETMNLKPIGTGAYGTVYRFRSNTSTQVVIKLSALPVDELCSTAGPVVESFLIRYFFRQFVLTGITPHLPIALGTVYSHTQNVMISASEYASQRTAFDYLMDVCSAMETAEAVFRVLLFQITYTLTWISNWHPTFRHNDLSLANVLVTSGPSAGYTKYTGPSGEVFRVPNLGVRAILWDFDLSSIVGTADNERTYRFHSENPEYGISYESHSGVDLYQFAMLACSVLRKNSDFKKTQLLANIIKIWGEEAPFQPLYARSPQVRLYNVGELPSASELLQSCLFEQWKSSIECTDNVMYEFGCLLRIPPLCTDDIVNMKSNRLFDVGNFSMPLGFGCDGRAAELLEQLPTVRVSRQCFPNSQPNVVKLTKNSLRNEPHRIEHFTAVVSAWLKYPGVSDTFYKTKLDSTLRIFCEAIDFLGHIELRYALLLLQLVFYNEPPFVETKDFMLDINCYSASRYDSRELRAGVMQYSWIRVLFLET
jgi:hypothetical protein